MNIFVRLHNLDANYSIIVRNDSLYFVGPLDKSE